MKHLSVVLCLLMVTTGCGLSNANSSGSGSASLASANGTYWKSNALPTSLYTLALYLNANGQGQCSYYSYNQWYGPYNISWQYSNGSLALGNGSDCLAPLIDGIQTTGSPVLGFSGTLEDGSAQYQLDFSQQTGSIP
jgi:hypothetical protein